jgi:hypothetical protein
MTTHVVSICKCVFFFIFMGQSKFRADESVYGQFMWTPLKTFLLCLNRLKLKLI